MPDTSLTLVVKRKQAPLAVPQKGTLVDNVLVMDGGANWLDIRQQLRELGVDTVVDMAGNDQSGLILAWGRARRLRPHRSDCKGMCALYSPFAESMPRLKTGLHRVDELLTFARHLGAADPVHSFRLELPDRAVEESEKMVDRHSLRSGSLIVLNIGASRDSKRWPAEHFERLAEGLIAEGHRVALTGARAFGADGHYDRTVAERFTATGLVDGEKCINLVTDVDLPPDLQLQRDAHFLRYSKAPCVVVGNDTGPMHIAGSVGEDAANRTVSLFGPTNWGRYAPYDPSRSYPGNANGRWNRVLCADVGCRPDGAEEACRNYRRGCATKECMRKLSTETVLEAVLAAAAGR